MKKVVEFVQSFVVIILVLSGIGGISYNLFRDDGWIEQFMGRVWDVGTRNIMFALLMVVAAIAVFMLWRGGKPVHGRTSRLPDFVVYGVMAAGVFFIVRFFLAGTV